MNKITIIGAGRVGEACALTIAKQDLCKQLVLLDLDADATRGTALDIAQTAPIFGFDTEVTGGSDASLIKDSGIIVVTAGFPRKPGMSRQDVLGKNVPIIDGVVENAKRYAPNAILLIVSNPVDVLTYRAFQQAGWPRERVFGQAGVLDAARMACFVAQETGFSAKDINALVLGGHGDTMVPMIRYTTVNGVSVERFLSPTQIEQIIQRTRHGGAEILNLKKVSSAYQAPGNATAAMVDAIVHKRNRLMPTVAILNGEYGEKDLAMGVPCILSEGGIRKIVELELNSQEKQFFDVSVQQLRKDIVELKALTA